MEKRSENPTNADKTERQYVTFNVDSLLLGVDIRKVQEINRQLSVTKVPQAPSCVCGVINLRGEVTTVVDLRAILGLDGGQSLQASRNLIVSSDGESIGLLVDSISDIISLRSDEIHHPPSNIRGVRGTFFEGVHTLQSEILVLLNVEEVLSSTAMLGVEINPNHEAVA